MRRLVFILPLAAFFAACSMKKAAVRVGADVIGDGAASLRDEADPALAKEAFPGQLKLIEGLLASDPDNKTLRLLAAEGFAAYALLFLEETDPERAKAMYDRARAHTGEDVDPAKAQKEDVPRLFWQAFAMAGKANLSRDSSEEVAKLPKIEAKMKRVWELDKEFQFAGADIFFGTYYASRPAMLGGDPAKARTHFEWARRLTGGKYLLTYVYEARHLAVGLQDRAMYEQLLKRVLESPAGQLPGARLADEVAKKRAAALLKEIDEYF